MAIVCSQVRKINTHGEGDHLQVLFLYPKLVIFEGTKHVRILNIEPHSEAKSTKNDVSYYFDQDVKDYSLQDHILYLILKSGELIVIDIFQGCQLKIIADTYRLCKIQYINDILYLVSESGEWLKSPFTSKELDSKLAEGVKEISVSLQKTHKLQASLEYKEINGLQIYSEQRAITVKCPWTGLCDVIHTNLEIDCVIPWRNLAVMASKSKMWLIDLTKGNIIYEFEELAVNYYPVKVWNNNLYYVLWNKDEIQISYAWNTSDQTEHQHESYADKSLSKLTSQDSLKSQMQSLVASALSMPASTQVLPEFTKCVEKIEDLMFLLDNVSKLCQHNIVYKSLLHSLQKKVFPTKDDVLIRLVNDLVIKMDLLDYISFRGNNTYKTINLFDLNFKQLCIMFIKNSDLDLASICWLKYAEMEIQMTADDVLALLNAIPHDIKLSALIIWLRNFMPPLLDNNPYFIDIFVKWTTQRVFLLEQSGYWPKIGLKFIDEIRSLLESSLKTISVRPISMDDLNILKEHINTIMELKDKYKINMLLGEISCQSPNEVSLIMLRRCYTEDIKAFLHQYLPTFSNHHLFEMDDALRSYIESEAAVCGGGIESSRLKIILDAFRSSTIKLECLLQVLKVLDVPWDKTVLDLAVTAASSIFQDFTLTDTDRLLAQEIQKELSYAKMKVILKKYNFPLSCTDYTLVLHKMIHAVVVDLDDLKVIMNVITAYSNYGNILYIDRCLKDCEIKAALDYFNSLAQKDKRVLLKSVVTKYEQILDRSSNNSFLEQSYLDFLKGTHLLSKMEINDIENLHHLKNSYGITLSMNSFYQEQCCVDVSASWTSDDGTTVSSGRGRCVNQLTQAHLSQQSILISLLRQTSTSIQVRKFVESLLKSLPKEDNKSKREITRDLSYFKDGQNCTLLLEAADVLIELVANCREEHVHSLMQCFTILNALINAHIVVKNLSTVWKFHYMYMPMYSVSSVNDFIDLSTTFLLTNRHDADLIDTVNVNDFTAFRKLGHLEQKQISGENELSQYDELKKVVAKKHISKVAASQALDEILLTSLLLILGNNAINEDQNNMWVLDTLQGLNETLPPPLLSYLSTPVIRKTFSLDRNLPSNAVPFPPQYILKTKFNINLAEIAISDSTEDTWDVKVLLLRVLRQYPNTSFERLVELCRTLNVAVNDGLSLQLISLLTTWELKYKISVTEFGYKQVEVENDEKSFISKCFLIWDSIDDKEFLKDILQDFWKNGEVTLHGRSISVNPYYYEVFICIYHLIYGSSTELRNKKEYFLLNFLKDYNRKSTPKQYEFENFSAKAMFPEIGHYRLPFHLFMREDMWSNLKSEITLVTYERWLPVVALLSLDANTQTARDMICSNALKQTMTSRKGNELSDVNNKDTEPWRLMSREEPLLRAAHRCARHIANMEWAGACLFYVLQGVARGADQVAAAHLCYQFAQRWAALQPGHKAVRQMERLYSSLSTRHALHKIEWAREEFVRLSSEPAQLIRALYLHPEFVEKMNRFDVNRAANEIADKNGINISSIRMQILENILNKNNEDRKNIFCGLDSKSLMTAKYILKATCPKMGAIYLSRIAFDDESDFDKCKKLRALQCLMSVVDPDTALKVTNRERDALWQSLLELLFVVNLENIDMPWIASIFVNNKVQALEQLLQTTGVNLEGFKIAASLAKRFGNTESIRGLMPLLLRTGLYEELIPLLLKNQCPPDDLVYTAWRAVILTPFQRADYPITDRQKSKCLDVINLLPVCPVIKDEDLIKVWKNCVRCKCFGLGCLVLPYISPQKRETIIELKKIDRRNLIASLKNLHSETYLVSGAMYVLENMPRR